MELGTTVVPKVAATVLVIKIFRWNRAAGLCAETVGAIVSPGAVVNVHVTGSPLTSPESVLGAGERGRVGRCRREVHVGVERDGEGRRVESHH